MAIELHSYLAEAPGADSLKVEKYAEKLKFNFKKDTCEIGSKFFHNIIKINYYYKTFLVLLKHFTLTDFIYNMIMHK